MCRTDWVSLIDDRSVLMPGYLDGIREAIAGNYIVCGAYEKRAAMTVENGIIKNAGVVTGIDSRLDYVNKHWKPHNMKSPYKAPGEWTYGCSITIPLEWALAVNGFSEDYCDGLGGEDYLFGLTLQNAGYPIRYDPRMKLIEDRTPELCGPTIHRCDKDVSPNDKSHKILEVFKGSKTSKNSYDLRELRAKVLAGEPWPPPSASKFDWYDGQPIADFDNNLK